VPPSFLPPCHANRNRSAHSDFTGLVNAYGIFAAYNKNNYPGYTLSKESIDTLRSNRFTKHLNFVGW